MPPKNKKKKGQKDPSPDPPAEAAAEIANDAQPSVDPDVILAETGTLLLSVEEATKDQVKTFSDPDNPIWTSLSGHVPRPTYYKDIFFSPYVPKPQAAGGKKKEKAAAPVASNQNIPDAQLITPWSQATLTMALVISYVGFPNVDALKSWILREGMYY